MEYRVVKVDCGPAIARDAEKAASELARLVNELIQQGWVPLGGLASVSVGTAIYLLQAMTRDPGEA